MWLVAGLARFIAGMIFDIHLRKRGGACSESTVTLRAEDLGIRELGNVLGRIGSVPGKWAVAGFAIHVRVLAGSLHGDDVTVAVLAGLVTGVDRLPGSDLGERVATVVSVLSEAVRDEVSTDNDEEENASYKDSGETEQVLRVFELRDP
jgi:hypothetical protein